MHYIYKYVIIYLKYTYGELLFMNTDIENNFIEDRFQSNYPTLLNNNRYMASTREFDKKYKSLIKELDSKNLELVEDIIDLQNAIASEEIYLSYKVGFSDGFTFSRNIN